MPPTLAIIAALPREIAPLTRGLRPHSAFHQRGVLLYELPSAVVIAAGMGMHRVTLALEAARAVAPIAAIVSAGLAGACTAELSAGVLAEACTVVDARTGERFAAVSSAPHTLVTTEGIAGVREKARLAAAYSAAMVDMEAATLARLAVAHSLHFRAVKAISDAHDFELPALAKFATPEGTFRTAAFALHTAVRPGTWVRAAELGRNSSRALTALTARLREMIAEQAATP